MSASVSPDVALVDDEGRDRVGVLEGPSFSSAFVDSALAGSQEDASLFCDVGELGRERAGHDDDHEPEGEDNHLVTRPVRRPAI